MEGKFYSLIVQLVSVLLDYLQVVTFQMPDQWMEMKISLSNLNIMMNGRKMMVI